ncbi:MAG: YfiR family protein [Rickettsiales bacterium]
MKHWIRHIAVYAALVTAGVGVISAPSSVRAFTLDEAQVKAGYIYNFMKFVDWPPEYLTQTFNLCVLGSNPFGKVLDRFTGKSIRNRPIRVVIDVPLAQTRYCHVVFVSRSESGRLTNALLRLRQTPILTISDIEGFANKGGVIELFTTGGGDVAFRISQKSAQEVGLRVSSKLLTLSK